MRNPHIAFYRWSEIPHEKKKYIFAIVSVVAVIVFLSSDVSFLLEYANRVPAWTLGNMDRNQAYGQVLARLWLMLASLVALINNLSELNSGRKLVRGQTYEVYKETQKLDDPVIKWQDVLPFLTLLCGVLLLASTLGPASWLEWVFYGVWLLAFLEFVAGLRAKQACDKMTALYSSIERRETADEFYMHYSELQLTGLCFFAVDLPIAIGVSISEFMRVGMAVSGSADEVARSFFSNGSLAMHVGVGAVALVFVKSFMSAKTGASNLALSPAKVGSALDSLKSSSETAKMALIEVLIPEQPAPVKVEAGRKPSGQQIQKKNKRRRRY